MATRASTRAGQTVSGGCLCDAVRFEITLPTLACAHCHCSMCRRAHGAGYVTWVVVPAAGLRVRQGEAELVGYRSSDHATRSFCGRCGSSLFFRSTRDPDRVDVALANLDAPVDRAPQLHVHYDDRVEWLPADPALPRLGGESGLEPRD